MNRRQIAFLASALLAVTALAEDRDTIYQTAPIDALMAGVYDGDYAVGDLTTLKPAVSQN